VECLVAVYGQHRLAAGPTSGIVPLVQAVSSEVEVNSGQAALDSRARERHQKMTDFLEQQQNERKTRQAGRANFREKVRKACGNR